ncbi:MAG: hypothetical protein H7840_04675 [Alphaproteobacteria bacterium]
MTNPLAYALRNNPQQFLRALEVQELEAVMMGCVDMLAKRAKTGDRKAALALASVYRVIGAVEI